MSIDNYTLHQLHGYEPGCEWCQHDRNLRNPKKKMNYDAMGEKFRKVANNLEKIGKMAEIIDEAEKNNPNGLIF